MQFVAVLSRVAFECHAFETSVFPNYQAAMEHCAKHYKLPLDSWESYKCTYMPIFFDIGLPITQLNGDKIAVYGWRQNCNDQVFYIQINPVLG